MSNLLPKSRSKPAKSVPTMLALFRQSRFVPALLLLAFSLTLATPACAAVGNHNGWQRDAASASKNGDLSISEGGFIEICTLGGIKLVPAPAYEGAQTPNDIDFPPPRYPFSFDDSKKCPYCQLKSSVGQAEPKTILLLSPPGICLQCYDISISFSCLPLLYQGFDFDQTGPPELS